LENKQVGCVQALLVLITVPVLDALIMLLNAWALHKIWAWYPPFGYAAPSVMALVALLAMICLVRNRRPPYSDEPLGKQIVGGITRGVVNPLMLLAIVVIARWFCS